MNPVIDAIILLIALTALGFSVRSWQLQSAVLKEHMRWRALQDSSPAPHEEREEYGDFDEEEGRE